MMYFPKVLPFLCQRTNKKLKKRRNEQKKSAKNKCICVSCTDQTAILIGFHDTVYQFFWIDNCVTGNGGDIADDGSFIPVFVDIVFFD